MLSIFFEVLTRFYVNDYLIFDLLDLKFEIFIHFFRKKYEIPWTWMFGQIEDVGQKIKN